MSKADLFKDFVLRLSFHWRIYTLQIPSCKCQTEALRGLVQKKGRDLVFLPALVTQAQVSAFIEEDTNILIRELVTEAVFVGVVHPLGYPDEGLGFSETRWVSWSWRGKENIWACTVNGQSKRLHFSAKGVWEQTCRHGRQAVVENFHGRLGDGSRCWDIIGS